MKSTLYSPARLRGEITVPGDKSISHRGVMFGAISEGITELFGFLSGADCISTIGCFRAMGIDIEQNGSHVVIHGKGLYGLSSPSHTLDAGNSGTTTRLISGILSGQSFSTVIDGDDSLRTRPMKRIIEPLSMMGANLKATESGCLPLSISPAPDGLSGITYTSPVASAQVKSCILLAGLYASSPTTVIEPALSRDHTERMLRGFGADMDTGVSFIPSIDDSPVTVEGISAVSGTTSFSSTVKPAPRLIGQRIEIPGDISSAAYFIAAGLIHPDAELLIKNVGINPTRAGILKVAVEMGGDITLENRRTVSGEDVADIVVRSSSLHGVEVAGDVIPTLIDELPMIAVMAACAEGETVIRDAAELKVKESDRIATVSENLSAMGVDVTATDDGMVIRGGAALHGAAIKTYNDHRIAMAFAIASLAASGETSLDHPECVDISYPDFYATLEKISE